MARLVLRGRRMRLIGGEMPRELASTQPWRVPVLPICRDVLERLRRANPQMIVDARVGNLIGQEDARAAQLGWVARQEDTDGDQRLFPYQRVGVEWLGVAGGGILADERGLGKSVMALLALPRLRAKRALILCSATKVPDWYEHSLYWTRMPVASLHTTPEKRADVLADWDGILISTIQGAAGCIDRLDPMDVLIVDEAHSLRNRNTRAFAIARKLSRISAHTILLTASPSVNHAADIWSLLNLLDPNRFASYWLFVQRFFDIDVGYFGVKVGALRESERAALNALLAEYMLARPRSVGQTLPPRTQCIVAHEMRGDQQAMYDQMAKRRYVEFNGKVVEAVNPVSLITFLRELALSPSLLFPDEYEGPSKVDTLIDLLRGERRQAVVFTSFALLAVQALDDLKRAGITSTWLTGSLSGRMRERHLAEFKRGDYQILLATHGTGGEGLNLTEASLCIFLDLAWHPAGNQHAQDRIYRLGQTADHVETVVIHSAGTIEDDVMRIIREKRHVTVEELLKGGVYA